MATIVMATIVMATIVMATENLFCMHLLFQTWVEENNSLKKTLNEKKIIAPLQLQNHIVKHQKFDDFKKRKNRFFTVQQVKTKIFIWKFFKEDYFKILFIIKLKV